MSSIFAPPLYLNCRAGGVRYRRLRRRDCRGVPQKDGEHTQPVNWCLQETTSGARRCVKQEKAYAGSGLACWECDRAPRVVARRRGAHGARVAALRWTLPPGRAEPAHAGPANEASVLEPSRVTRMESVDRSVSLDLLIRALLAGSIPRGACALDDEQAGSQDCMTMPPTVVFRARVARRAERAPQPALPIKQRNGATPAPAPGQRYFSKARKVMVQPRTAREGP